MSNIDRLAAQDAARTYTHNTDVARSGAAALQAVKARQTQQQHAKSADSVTLSEGARSLAAARDVVQNAPDVREHKVAQIKQQVSDGTYSVSPQVLARKMLDTHA